MLLIRIQSYNEPIKVGENNLYGFKKKPRNGNGSGSDQVSLYLNLYCLINSFFFFNPQHLPRRAPVGPVLSCLTQNHKHRNHKPKITNIEIKEIIEYTCNEPKNELKNSQYFLGYFLAIQMDAKI